MAGENAFNFQTYFQEANGTGTGSPPVGPDDNNHVGINKANCITDKCPTKLLPLYTTINRSTDLELNLRLKI